MNTLKGFLKKMDEIINGVIKFRWIIALVFFVLCVIFKVHGTSIGIYDNVLPTHVNEAQANHYRLFGKDRIIRTDEYVVHTPTYFSQYYNNYNKYSNQMSIDSTNMLLDYYAPVKDITVLGKPFNWGYLIFGNERGLSFYWCGLQITLFMTAFELFYILTKRNKILSLVGMFMMGFAPTMQWWMIPHITIVFVYAMALFDIAYYMLIENNKLKKWVYAVTLGLLASGFALSIFPSCQIVAGAVIAVLLVTCLIRDREKLGIRVDNPETKEQKQLENINGSSEKIDKKLIKENVFKLIISAFIALGILGYFIITSRADLKLLTNTVYPGKRVVTGQYCTLKDLFTNLSSFTLAFRDSNVLNNCEVSTFIHFAPLFLLMFPGMERRLRTKNNEESKMDLLIGKALFIMLLVEIVFMCMGVTSRIAKLTLLKYVNRMQIGYGFTAVICSIWMLNVLWKNKDFYKKSQLIFLALIYGFLNFMIIDVDLKGYLNQKILILEILVLILILLLGMLEYKKLFTLGMCGLLFFAGGFVNPICFGISPITNHKISKCISDTAKKDKTAYWLVIDDSGIMSNFVLANGGKSLSSTNFYPDNAKWKIIDKNGEKSDIYNRYANFNVNLTEKKTSIKLLFLDRVGLNINPKDLSKLNVRYILTNKNVEKSLNQCDIKYKKICIEDGYKVLKLQNK